MKDGFSFRDNSDFKSEIVDLGDLLDKAVEWISFKLRPEQVFLQKDLERWAEENGYEKRPKEAAKP